MTDDELDDLSYSALEELLGCGVERRTLLRYFKTIRNRATPAPAHPDPLHVANERGEGEPVAWVSGKADGSVNFWKGWRLSPVQTLEANLPLYLRPLRSSDTASPIEGKAHIVRLAEDFADACVRKGYVSTSEPTHAKLVAAVDAAAAPKEKT